MQAAVTVGDSILKFALGAHDATTWHLADHLGTPTVLVFHRHLG